MAVLPQEFRKSPPFVFSFNFSEVASGVGMQIYYLAETQDSTGAKYVITSDSTFRSKDIEHAETSASSSSASWNYDLTPFLNNVTIEGTGYLICSLAADMGTGTTADVTVGINLQSYDGTTGTSIVSVTSDDFETTAATKTNQDMTIPITIPKTNIPKGSNIRATITLTWTLTSGSNNSTYYVGQDPANRDGTGLVPSSDSTTTQLKLYIPYRLDI